MDKAHLSDLDSEDDIALLGETKRCLQEMTTSLETEAKKIGLCINLEKTKFM